MGHPIPDIIICGTGPQALEAARVLKSLNATVEAFIRLPWEPACQPGQEAATLEGAAVLEVGEYYDPMSCACVLLATERPRKARKLLREVEPEQSILESLDQLLDFIKGALKLMHPPLFPDRPDPDNRRMFDYDKSLLPNKLLALMEEDVGNVEEAFPNSGLSVGYPGWNLLYYSCLCSLRPGVFNIILETGTNVGCSTIVLAQALKDSGYQGYVMSADMDAKLLSEARRNLVLAGVDHLVNVMELEGVHFLHNRGCFQQGPGQAIPFVFLDDCHEAQHVFQEFQALHPWLDAHSTVFFDNVDDAEGVAGALELIVKHFGGNVVRFGNTSWNPPGQALWQANGLQGVGT